MPEDVRQVPLDNTSGGGASTSAPGAGSQFVGVTPPAGLYRVYVTYQLTGTAETQLANIRLKTKGATLISGLPSISAFVWSHTFDRVEADGTNPIQLVCVSAATGSSVYTGSIICNRIG